MSESMNFLGKTIRVSGQAGASTTYTDKITVAVCNKVFEDLNNVLLQKGLTSQQISADNPTGLVDAVKALPTNTIGGIRRDYPIAMFPKNLASITSSGSLKYHDVINDKYFRVNTYSEVYFRDLDLITWDTANQSTAGGDPILTINKASLQALITDVTLANVCFWGVPNSCDVLYYSTSGHCGKVTVDMETLTISATCVTMTPAENSTVSTFTDNKTMIYATNGTKALAKTSTTGLHLLIDIHTGETLGKYFPFANGIEAYNGYSGVTSQLGKDNFVLIGRGGGYSDMYFVDINWEDMDNSTRQSMVFSDSSEYGYDSVEEKIYFLKYFSNVIDLTIYDINARTFTNKQLSYGYSNAVLGNIPSLSFPYLGRNLFIEKLSNGYTQILSSFGFFWIDENNNFVTPVSGSTLYCLRVQNATAFTASFYMLCNPIIKREGKYYSIYFGNNGNGFNNGLITPYYGKIFLNYFVRNNEPVIYIANKTATKELFDGNTLDADTVTIEVDVASVGESGSAVGDGGGEGDGSGESGGEDSGGSGESGGSENTSGQEG